jgi:hypothetical protein
MSKLINYVGHLDHLDETKDLADNMAKRFATETSYTAPLREPCSSKPKGGKPLLLLQGERLRLGSIAIVLLQWRKYRRRGTGNVQAFGAVAGYKFVNSIA